MATGEYITGIIDDLAEHISQYAATDTGVNLPAIDVTRFLRLFKDNQTVQPLQLSSVRPDFEQILRQLHAFLESKKSWNEIIPAGGGQTLIEMVAAVGTMLQLSIQRALQENFADTAQAPSSVYLRMLSLGVRLLRKRPSKVLAKFTNTRPSVGMTIPSYTQFYIDGSPFFNRFPISLPQNVPTILDVPLYQGEVRTAQFQSNGQPFQKFEIGDDDFAVSNDDVICLVGPQGEEYTRIQDGLWNYSGADKVFHDRTTQYGNVELSFGNNVYGVKPSSGVPILFKYAVTAGRQSNISTSNLPITSTAVTDIEAVTTSHAVDGDDEKTPEFYRNVGSSIFATKNRCVTEEDFVAKALEYPGVIDIKVLGQRDTAPDLTSRMNVVTLIPITAVASWTTEQKTAFREYLESFSITSLNFLLEEPAEITLNIEADIYCQYGVDLEVAKNYLVNKLNEKFKLRRGSLGFSIYRSDIDTTLVDPTFKVDYIILKNPTSNIIVNKKSYVKINNITLNTFYSSRPDIT